LYNFGIKYAKIGVSGLADEYDKTTIYKLTTFEAFKREIKNRE